MVSMDELIKVIGEDFTRFMHVNFLSTEQITFKQLGSGGFTKNIFELIMSTGSTSNSYAWMYFDVANFTIKFGTLLFKAVFSEEDGYFAFMGFKENLNEPEFNMTDNHAGFMVYDGKLYISVADGDNQQKLEIVGFDWTNNLLYKVKYNEFWLKPLPVIVPYFDGWRIEKPMREWKNLGTLGTFPPTDQAYYLMFYIKNSVNYDRRLTIKHIVYGEEYAD